MASGATLFTFPALIAVGLPPVMANATNFLALLPSNAAALPAYKKELKSVGRAIWPVLTISSIGAVLGALLLLNSGEVIFINLIPFLIFGATLLFMFGNQMRNLLISQFEETGRIALFVSLSMLFIFSIYGGYFGAGAGIIILATMQIMGYSNYHVANSLKNLLATSLTIFSIIVFGLNGAIAWPEALVMMIGSTVGGYVGGLFGRKINERYLKIVMVCFGFFLSGYYYLNS